MMLEKITAVGVASSERRRCAELNKVASRGLGITGMTMEQRPEAAKEVRPLGYCGEALQAQGSASAKASGLEHLWNCKEAYDCVRMYNYLTKANENDLFKD